MEVGLVGYGVYLPRRRITADEYRKGWGSFSAAGVAEKTVLGLDEDVVTMSVAAGIEALAWLDGGFEGQWGLFAASPAWPYAEKSQTASLAAMLGLPEDTRPAQFGGSANCGLTALLAAADFTAAEPGQRRALVLVADAPPGRPGDSLEQAAGAAAAAFVLGPGQALATIEGAASAVEEVMGARYRLDGAAYLEDIEVRPFSDEALIGLSTRSAQSLMDGLGLEAEDYNYAALPQFDARTPLNIGRRLGLAKEKIKPYLILPMVGDVGAAGPVLGLINVLEVASHQERVLTVSYGSGAESHALSLIVGNRKDEIATGREALSRALADKFYLTFNQYLKTKKALKDR